MKPRASSNYKTCIVGGVSKNEVRHHLPANRPYTLKDIIFKLNLATAATERCWCGNHSAFLEFVRTFGQTPSEKNS
jgi:hypothetical protein